MGEEIKHMYLHNFQIYLMSYEIVKQHCRNYILLDHIHLWFFSSFSKIMNGNRDIEFI